MTLTRTPPRTTTTRRAAWLLVLTLPAFVAYLAVAVTTVARKVDSSAAELTHAQLSELGLSWVALHVLWISPAVLAAIGLERVAAGRRLPRAPWVRLLAATVLMLAAGYLVVQ